MNTFSKITLAAFGLLLSLSLTSCETEKLLTPDGLGRPTRSTTDNTETTGPVLPNPVIDNILRTYGQWQLTYDGKGQLAKAQSTVDPTLSRDYHWAPAGTAVTVTQRQGGKIKSITVIERDVKGRAEAATVVTYSIMLGQEFKTVDQFAYSYDSQNRLVKIQEDKAGNTFYQLDYTAAGLTTVAYKSYGAEFRSVSFSPYTNTNQTYKDHNHLNVAAFAVEKQVDELLPIYGKANPYLPVTLTFYENDTWYANLNALTGQRNFAYAFNNAGLITERKEVYHTPDNRGSFQKTTLFAYGGL